MHFDTISAPINKLDAIENIVTNNKNQLKMKKKLLIAVVLVLIISVSFAQTTITLQPNSEKGKDAYFKDLTPTLNQGSHQDFSAIAWTNVSNPVIARSVIDFDFSSIPSGSIVNSAYLSLYNNSTSVNNGGEHSSMSGPNTAVLKRITSSWEEFTITWNNQPSTSSLNEVQLPQSTTANHDYINIDVTILLQDIIDNPSTSFGFMISLETELYYRCIILSSSDHSDSTKHPKLIVTYTAPNGITNIDNSINFLKTYPNPCSDHILIEFDNSKSDNHTLKLYDNQGRLVHTITGIVMGKAKIETKNLISGLYFLQLETAGRLNSSCKIIIE